MSASYYLTAMVNNCVSWRQLGSCSMTRPFLSLRRLGLEADYLLGLGSWNFPDVINWYRTCIFWQICPLILTLYPLVLTLIVAMVVLWTTPGGFQGGCENKTDALWPLQTHYLLYGSGFQTWEYSPTYAIRSYGYLLLHLFPMLVTNTANKVCVCVWIEGE